jgi:hypothetical protein
MRAGGRTSRSSFGGSTTRGPERRVGGSTDARKKEGFRASLKTSARVPVCLPRSREAGYNQRHFRRLNVFAAHSLQTGDSRRIRSSAAPHLSKPGFGAGSSSPPERLDYVALVYSLASEG